MYIHNATFMIDPFRGDEFLRWFTPLAFSAGRGRSPRLSVLRRAGDTTGDTSPSGEPASIAYQVEFETLAEADRWVETRLHPLRAQFERRFSPGMVFTSVFETVEPENEMNRESAS